MFENLFKNEFFDESLNFDWTTQKKVIVINEDKKIKRKTEFK
jgi:hypothetical protein